MKQSVLGSQCMTCSQAVNTLCHGQTSLHKIAETNKPQQYTVSNNVCIHERTDPGPQCLLHSKSLTWGVKPPRYVNPTGLPCMVQFAMIRTPRLWNAEGSPHSGGRVPDRKLLPEMPAPICSCCKAGKEPFPQKGGRVPDRLVSSRVRRDKFGNAPGLPHDVGRVPVTIQKIKRSCFLSVEVFSGVNSQWQDNQHALSVQRRSIVEL